MKIHSIMHMFYCAYRSCYHYLYVWNWLIGIHWRYFFNITCCIWNMLKNFDSSNRVILHELVCDDDGHELGLFLNYHFLTLLIKPFFMIILCLVSTFSTESNFCMLFIPRNAEVSSKSRLIGVSGNAGIFYVLSISNSKSVLYRFKIYFRQRRSL